MNETAGKVWRFAFLASVVALSVFAGRAAAVASLGVGRPELALRLDSNDATALVKAADRRLTGTGRRIELAELASVARRALRSEPLNAIALRQIGLSEDARKNHPLARKLMFMANRVSRRDFGIHVWMIEDRVAADDLAGALDSYDLALSSSDDTPKVLYPVLGAALEDAEIRAAFAPYLNRRRPWMPGLLNQAISTSSDPQVLAAMFVARGGLPADDVRYRPVEALLVRHLVAKQQYVAARHYAISLRGVRAGALDDVAFTDQTTNSALGPLSWQFSDGADVQASREDSDLVLLARPNTQGIAATRMLMLAPGTYELKYLVSPLPQTATAGLTIELSCLPGIPSNSAPIFQQPINLAGALAERRSHSLSIPPRCRAQQFTLTIAGRDLQAESGIRIGAMALRSIIARKVAL